MSILKQYRLRKSAILALALFLGACASAPVQEMSDARQAIYAAKQVVSQASPSHLNVQKSELLLEEAKQQLRAGDYDLAREKAEQAKRLAIEAREDAVGDQIIN